MWQTNPKTNLPPTPPFTQTPVNRDCIHNTRCELQSCNLESSQNKDIDLMRLGLTKSQKILDLTWTFTPVTYDFHWTWNISYKQKYVAYEKHRTRNDETLSTIDPAVPSHPHLLLASISFSCFYNKPIVTYQYPLMTAKTCMLVERYCHSVPSVRSAYR